MYYINLLPKSEKRIIRLEEVRRVLQFFTAGAVAIFTIGSVLLLPSYLPLFLQRQELKRSLAIEQQAVELLNLDDVIQSMRSMKVVVGTVENVLATPPKASELVDSLFRQTYEGITMQSIALRDEGVVQIQGFAETRRNLLNLEELLRSSDRFLQISFPLSSIVRQTEINFTMQGVLKEEERL